MNVRDESPHCGTNGEAAPHKLASSPSDATVKRKPLGRNVATLAEGAVCEP